MRIFFSGIIFFCCVSLLKSQSDIDSLTERIGREQGDTNKVNDLNLLSKKLNAGGDLDRSVLSASEALELAQNISFRSGLINAYNNMGTAYFNRADYPNSLRNHLAALKIREELNDRAGVARSQINIGSFLQKRKANIEIRRQKELIEEKQREVLDSIHYAKRIQTSLLTSEPYIARQLKALRK